MREFMKVTCALAILLSVLPGCRRNQPLEQAQAPISMLNVPSATNVFSQYEDDRVIVRTPSYWRVTFSDDSNAHMHLVDIRNAHQLFARVTVLSESKDANAFASEVIQGLKSGNENVTAQPIEMTLAGVRASGFQYAFKTDREPWMGWVVALEREGQVVSFLGQFPASLELALKPVLCEVMKTCRFKDAKKASAETGPIPVKAP